MIKELVAPYLSWIKVAGLAAILGAGVWLGFRLDPDPPVKDCGQLNAEIAAELATLRAANASYEELEKARAEEADRKRNDLLKKNEEERIEAARREAVLEKKLEIARKELDEAKANPKCAELLELEICETITLPQPYSR